MRKPALIALLMLVLPLLACSLGTPPPTATPTTEPTQTTVFIDARTTTAVPATATRAATAAPTAVLRPNCAIRADWFVYVVAPGETLGRIAARAGTSAAALASANCLANPDVIYAGQLLRVPVILPVITPTWTPPGNQVAGAVIPSPYVSVANGQYALTPDATVALVWQITPAITFTRVDFFLTPTGTGTTASLIGTDTYLADGIAINFRVPRGLLGYVSAIAYYGSGIVGRTAQDTMIYALPNVELPQITPRTLTITPYISLNNNTFVLQSGQSVSIQWNAGFPEQTQRVDFFLIPPTGANGMLLGTDYNLTDGAQIVWNTVPPDIQGTLRAVATFPSGTEPQSSAEYYIVTEVVQ